MGPAGPGASGTPPARSRVDRLAAGADRAVRVLGDARLGLVLLLVAAGWNAAAAVLTGGSALLESPVYPILLGAVLLTGLASVGVRAPGAWREWRRPAPPPEGREALVAVLPLAEAERAGAIRRAAELLRRSGYLLRESGPAGLAGVRRGWSRFAGVGSHLALVLLVLGAAIGTAFSSETTFSLLPGEQALLDLPRPGFTSAVRLDRFDAEFGPDGRPLRLDATVTFLRDGDPVSRQLVQVNQPGSFDGYLVHGWTYGPAVRLRIEDLAGQPLLDGPVALDGSFEGRPAATVDLPSAGVQVGLVLADPSGNRLAVSLGGASGIPDATSLRPGETARLGRLRVSLLGFDAYLTFVSRSDPGMGLLFGSAVLLTVSLAVAFWLPRRRVGLRVAPEGMRLVLRGERFDRPAAEFEVLAARLAVVLGEPIR